MALFVKLEVPCLDTEEIAEATMAERGCVWTAKLLAKRSESDGWFLRSKLRGEGADDALIAGCIDAGLLEADGRRLRPVGWLAENPSQAAIEAKRVQKQLNGIAGNHERWHSGPIEVCVQCQTKIKEVVAGSDTGAIAAVVPSDPDVSQPIAESESDLDQATDRPPSQNGDGFGGPKPVTSIASAKSALAAPVSEAG